MAISGQVSLQYVILPTSLLQQRIESHAFVTPRAESGGEQFALLIPLTWYPVLNSKTAQLTYEGQDEMAVILWTTSSGKFN